MPDSYIIDSQKHCEAFQDPEVRVFGITSVSHVCSSPQITIVEITVVLFSQPVVTCAQLCKKHASPLT